MSKRFLIEETPDDEVDDEDQGLEHREQESPDDVDVVHLQLIRVLESHTSQKVQQIAIC